MVDMTQLTGDYAASWLPWIMIPLVFYILPFPVFAILFLWIQKEGDDRSKQTDSNLTEIREMGAPTP
jgi:photosystem I subunit 8